MLDGFILKTKTRTGQIFDFYFCNNLYFEI